LFAAFILAAILLLAPVMAAATTSVHIVKYANDNTTILNETTVDFAWMEANLPVHGDGVTHYYMQGPVFNSSITDKWNPEENDPAILTKDFGAVKGTDLKDLCDLVGGMQADDYNVTLMASSDGFSKTFAYSSIYNPPVRAGPIILTWYRADQGYVNGSYSAGMRNVMFADTSTNPWGDHVFGLWDMHEAYPEPFWYFYQTTPVLLPSATGLSVQNTDSVLIYTNDPAPLNANFTANVTTGQVPLTVQFNDTSTGGPTSWAWDFFNGGTIDSNIRNPVYTYPVPGNYSVNLTVRNADGKDSEVKTNFIHVTTVQPVDWSLLLIGSQNVTLTRTQFETIVASGPNATYTDPSTGRVWTGIPLWYLAGIVDDNEASNWTFNDTLAAQGYTVNVTSTFGSAFTKSFSSSSIARNSNYIVANTLNGTPLPFTDPSNPSKYWWPLKLVGVNATGGSSVGNITEISLSGLPAAPPPVD
jgi:PKD repeat protein